MVRSLRGMLFVMACSVSAFASAQGNAVRQIDIPAGELVTALDSLARQSGAQFIYQADQLKGLRTGGVHGTLSADQALGRLLAGTGFTVHRDDSGAVVIVKGASQSVRPASSATPAGSRGGASADPQEATRLDEIQVTGSRIPRAQVEGPAPVTVITANDIKASGFASVPDVMRAITQNSGETQSQQSSSGADFSPGAEEVDLRGLGPNHTLVLVNGRRIADFPMPFKGRSNFTDVSNIPIGMIDRIEVLTGSASAVYGSDAISGVVNFILKDHADGTTIDLRYGDTTRGGGASTKLDFSTGFSHDDFNLVFGAELIDQKPLWAYDRKIQDSTADAPTERSQVPRRTFLNGDWNDDYIDPGQATCDALGYLNGGTTVYANRPRYGNFCGSAESIGYGTILSQRRGINTYTSANLKINDNLSWFGDMQLGWSKVELFRDVEQWNYQAPDGNEDGYFYNAHSGGIENWYRQFTPEEMGGLGRGMIENTQKTFSLTTGLKGTFGQAWDYEASLSHSQYKALISWPQTVASKANDLYLGPQLGVDADSGLPIFDADPSRLYTPLSRAEYDSITARTNYHPESRSDTLAFTLTNTELFSLPAGPAGFAGVVEYGNQSYDLKPDPLATQYYYYSWKDSDGHGSRNRWAAAGELRMPLLDSLNWSVAGRYDQYRFSGHKTGKLTWSTGLEWRPLDTLLVRGSYGTAFRAPDLHYVYAGIGNDETSGNDYYRCRTEEPGVDITDCDYSDEGLIRTRQGNRDLDSETSTSWTGGFVWSPTPNLDFSIDYFNIRMQNQVQDLSTDRILQLEASCRIGSDVNGNAVDANSPSCIDAISRVNRYPADSAVDPGGLYGIFVNPINVANERTSGVDVSSHYKLETAIGTFRFSGNYTWTRNHLFQQYPGDPTLDELAVNSGFDIPREKTSASVSWERKAWSATLFGSRLGRLPNSDSYDQIVDTDAGEAAWVHATYRYNATLQYNFSDHAQLSLAVDNLFDKLPPRDPSYTAYPYYDVSWFDAAGRSYFLQFTWKLGGSAL
ncbi:TonB-dependent receptor [Rhodanobacter spathiphylli]|uniref:TonB-dependent receptor n=1 Tax=Rhodanobacter spathiphylli B39 TaxID=1163407 RepID=I4W2S2_9GAMM|nr:TonB-dependent receptor [Rhodanobacter spathiphylli]EIL93763.1 TonB-dependent receptor [Rhodanobacter spathiphylli B39]